MNTDISERLYGLDLFGEPMNPPVAGVIAEKFLFPPFSILDTRKGEWQERKRAWIGIGLKGETGRVAKAYNCHDWIESKRKDIGIKGWIHGGGPSIFDPVLCELLYSWFCPPAGQVLDPFAGGSVRGIVAGALGMNYWGCDLRQEQIDANNEQADKIETVPRPEWVCGDSMERLDGAPQADFLFSCPPYGDLEVYSDDPADLSNMDYHTFVAAYKRIILKACNKLKQHRFACFVVGDFRGKRGYYQDFVSETIRGFKNAGLELYNEAILVTAFGSASMRITKQFAAGRKFCKTHQNVLVFCKGDWRKAMENL